jgi:hypothetical protein
MSHRRLGRTRSAAGSWLWCLAVIPVLLAGSLTWAGHSGFGRFGAVGGVSIKADGVVSQAAVEDVKLYRSELEKESIDISADMKQPVELRKISLRQIEQAFANAEKDGTPLPDEIRFLAGIQRIQYVLIYPEQNDIVLAGPGEGWKIAPNATRVGVTTGRPVLRVEDLLIALRSVEEARQGGITVSIDPTASGRQQFEAFMSKQKVFSPAVLPGIEKALGPQEIKVTGVPDTSRFARILVASDFRMKRIAMKLDESPLASLPSFLDVMKRDRVKLDNMMPRWWLACNYEPLGKSPDGLAWEIRGPGVKCMTEDEIIATDGSVKQTGKANPAAQKWADMMTEQYDELSAKEPVFGELRNLMDLCVVAALIAKEDLLAKANLKLPALTNADSKTGLTQWHAPKTVATQCSFIKRDREYIITASGGVEIASWAVADRAVESPEVGQVRTKAAASGSAGNLWWN